MTMRRWGYWALVCAVMAAAGCASMHRPYAHDPLLRSTRGVWGDPARGRAVDSTPPAEPDAPHPPDYLVGSGVTTMVPLSWPVNTALPSTVNAMQ
jgi:hypothetical protein